MPIKLTSVNDLDAPQKRVIKHEPLNDNIHVTGPPGSGKTNVAVLRAQMLIQQGYTNLLFLTYNHSVVSFVQTMFKLMGLSTNVQVTNKDAFLIDLAKSAGHYFRSNNGPYWDQYSEVLRFLKSRNLVRNRQLIILDEAQDFYPDEIEILKAISEKMIAVGDYDQKISNIRDNRDSFREFQPFSLGTIYRYGTAIANMAQQFATTHNNLASIVTRRGNSTPYRVVCNSQSEAVNSIARIIQNRKYADTTMAIISPVRDKLKSLKQSLQLKMVDVFFPASNKEYRQHNFDLKTPVLLTPDSSKGTEYDSVILYGFEEGGSMYYQRRERLFVSITRTCNELYLIQEPATIPELKNNNQFVTMTDTPADSTITDF